VELGEGDDPDRVPKLPTLTRVFDEVRASLIASQERPMIMPDSSAPATRPRRFDLSIAN
jgi:hypothetical protein